MQKRNKSTAQPSTPADKLPRPPVVDPEMGVSRTSSQDQDMVITTFQYDHGLEFFGHLAVNEAPDLDTTVTSTIGYNAEELAEIFHGL